MMRRRLLAGILAVLGASTFPGLAHASSSCRGNPRVTFTATTFEFGVYDPLLGTDDYVPNQAITVNATCNRSRIPFTVTYTLSVAQGHSGSYNPRYMVSGTTADHLQYNLYTDAARTQIWGDGTGGSTLPQFTMTGTCQRNGGPNGRNCSASQDDTVYGTIFALQNIAPGDYSDALTVNINF